jgi:hypothetical protein
MILITNDAVKNKKTPKIVIMLEVPTEIKP